MEFLSASYFCLREFQTVPLEQKRKVAFSLNGINVLFVYLVAHQFSVEKVSFTIIPNCAIGTKKTSRVLKLNGTNVLFVYLVAHPVLLHYPRSRKAFQRNRPQN